MDGKRSKAARSAQKSENGGNLSFGCAFSGVAVSVVYYKSVGRILGSGGIFGRMKFRYLGRHVCYLRFASRNSNLVIVIRSRDPPFPSFKD